MYLKELLEFSNLKHRSQISKYAETFIMNQICFMQSWSGPLNLKCPLLPFSIQLFQIKGELFTRLNWKCFLFFLIFKWSTFSLNQSKMLFLPFPILNFILLSMWDPVHRKTLLLRPALVTALDFSTRPAPQWLKRISQGPQLLKKIPTIILNRVKGGG